MFSNRFDLWSRACFDGDDGGDGGSGDDGSGDDAASQDAAAEGVGGGTGVGGTATDSEAAGGAVGGEIGSGATTGVSDAMDTRGGFGVGGLGSNVADATATATADAAASQAEEDAFGGMHTNEQATGIGEPNVFERELFEPLPNVPKSLQPPNTIGKGILGMISALAPQPIGLGITVAQGLTSAFGGVPGTDIDAYGTSIGDVGTTGGADSGFGVGGSQGAAGGGDNFALDSPNTLPVAGSDQALPVAPVAPAGPQRPERLDIPEELLPYLNPGMTDEQLRSVIANGALNNSNAVYRTQKTKDFYDNLVQRALIDESGNFNDIGALLPIEQQYALQSRGIESYEPNAESYLSALAA